jgi:photosystem II stability/assembly factor-like uncharacterized protein
VVDETTSLALADLPDASVQAVTTTADNRILYAALDEGARTDGFYRSEDQGRTWQAIESELDPTVINTLMVDSNDSSKLYAGTEGGPLGTANNVWRSQDGGQSWHNFNLSLPASPARIVPAVTAIVTDPNRPGILYVGTDGQGVYRFDEDQLGYELVGGASLADVHVRDLLVDTNSRLYALTNKGLFTFEASAWQQMDALPGIVESLAIAPLNPQILYAGVPSNGVYRSMDGGQTWEHVVQGLGWAPGASLLTTALAVDPKNPGHVVAATAYSLGIHHLSPAGIYESHTGGEGWAKVADTNSLVTQLTFTPEGVLAATEQGLKRYETSNELQPIFRKAIYHEPLNRR